jgi:hypothetical protein
MTAACSGGVKGSATATVSGAAPNEVVKDDLCISDQQRSVLGECRVLAFHSARGGLDLNRLAESRARQAKWLRHHDRVQPFGGIELCSAEVRVATDLCSIESRVAGNRAERK